MGRAHTVGVLSAARLVLPLPVPAQAGAGSGRATTAGTRYRAELCGLVDAVRARQARSRGRAARLVAELLARGRERLRHALSVPPSTLDL